VCVCVCVCVFVLCVCWGSVGNWREERARNRFEPVLLTGSISLDRRDEGDECVCMCVCVCVCVCVCMCVYVCVCLCVGRALS